MSAHEATQDDAPELQLFSHIHEIQVEWGDCDAAGIVFYPRYFAYFDACTGRLFDTALAMRKRDWAERYGIIGVPMVDTRASFHLPSRYGDLLKITTRVTAIGRSSIEIVHRVLNAGMLALEGYEKRVWAGRDPDDPGHIFAKRIPDEVRARLSGG